MFLSGTFEHTLDAKNRLTLPAKFRAQLTNKVFVFRGDDPCLTVFPESSWEAAVQEMIGDTRTLSREGRRKNRKYYAFADGIELDAAGRMVLNAIQLRHAHIEGRDVIVTGTGDSLEVWNPENWAKFEAELREADEDED